jgi:hypothetical protein
MGKYSPVLKMQTHIKSAEAHIESRQARKNAQHSIRFTGLYSSTEMK